MPTQAARLFRIDHVKLRVRDVDRSAAFYRDLFGLEERGDRTLGGRMRTCVTRMSGSGDEFALIAADPDPSELVARLASFRDLLARSPLVVDGAAVQVTISAGVALRNRGETFNQLYSEADEALYAAKAAGRNRICLSAEFAARTGAPSTFVDGRPLSVA